MRLRAISKTFHTQFFHLRFIGFDEKIDRVAIVNRLEPGLRSWFAGIFAQQYKVAEPGEIFPCSIISLAIDFRNIRCQRNGPGNSRTSSRCQQQKSEAEMFKKTYHLIISLRSSIMACRVILLTCRSAKIRLETSPGWRL